MHNNDKLGLNMVIGYPLHHTQSPLLHQIIYRTCHTNAVMMAMPSPDLKQVIAAIKNFNVGLTAVTMPFKEEVLQYVDNVECRLAACNTLIQRDHKLYAYNTDVDGIRYALSGVTLHKKRVLLIGVGGAARAAADVLTPHDVTLYWLNRTKEKADNIARELSGEAIDQSMLASLEIDIIINATPCGMLPAIHETPLPNYTFNKKQIVFDMVYRPVETALLKAARLAGAKIISGLEMFIGQGIKQVEYWQNKSISTDCHLDKIRHELIQVQKSS